MRSSLRAFDLSKFRSLNFSLPGKGGGAPPALNHLLLDEGLPAPSSSGLSGGRGVEFNVNPAGVTVKSIRIYPSHSLDGEVSIWRGTTRQANFFLTFIANEWNEIFLDTPLDFVSGERVSVFGHSASGCMFAYGGARTNLGLDAGDPVTYVQSRFTGWTASDQGYPGSTTTSNYYGLVDFGF